METKLSNTGRYIIAASGLLVLLGLYLVGTSTYLLFHSLAEMFSIVIACGIFMVAWNSRQPEENTYFLFVGIAYLFVGGMDLLHTLAYPGMGIFPGADTNLAAQIWIVARAFESVSLLLAALLLGRSFNVNLVFLPYALVFLLAFESIFHWNIFPDCFVEGVGLTPFKKGSEYVISLILAASIYPLYRKRERFDTGVLRLLVASIIVTIASELTFTLYIRAYGFANFVGHLLKILSFYLIYRAVIYSGLRRPFAVLFRDLKQSEKALRDAFEESSRHASETSALLECSHAILEELDFADAAAAVFKSCKNLIGAAAGYVALLSKDGAENEVLFLDSGGLPCTVDPELPMPIRGLRAEAYNTGKPVYENRFDSSEWNRFLPAGHAKLLNVLFAPLLLDGQAVGLIGLANKPGGFTDNDARLAAAFADHAAIALQNSRSLEALRESEVRYRNLSESLEETVKRKMAELQQAERLAAMGRMVSTVAHEVRNPLQNIQMGVDAMHKKIGQDKDKREILEEINYGVGILNEIIGELLEYAKPLELHYSSLSVRQLVEQVLKTLTHKLPNIDTHLELECEERKISVDTVRFAEVLVNLISNAVEAMPNGGNLKIHSRLHENDGTPVLRLSISDTGAGIKQEHMERIYEPFFTTKTRGIGLGIPACKKIIEAHSGSLFITSKLNEGTRVEITLPIGTT